MLDFERQDSRKRRRLSERRRVFSRIGSNNSQLASKAANDQSWSSSSQQQQHANQTLADLTRQQSDSSRSDSPLGEGSKISMKIQFHITVAPDHEPLILDSSSLTQSSAASTTHSASGKNSTESIGDHIHERLSKQNSMSARRRQQLQAMHNRMALNGEGSRGRANSARCERDETTNMKFDDDLAFGRTEETEAGNANEPLGLRGGRDTGARASTITGGMSDEATVKFLAQHQSTRQPERDQKQGLKLNEVHDLAQPPIRQEREHIYFKRDGQRFGHEFTLKLAVDRTYRCLLKIRPLIPLQAISIQGHHVLFADCSQRSSGIAAGANTITPSSAPASSSVLNHSWQDIRNRNQRHNQQQNHYHRLNHAKTTSNLSRTSLAPSNKLGYLYQQQQNQMMRYFSASHCSSSSNSHLGSQLIYMFDWSASRFEVNKNKARTQIQTVLKFKNGQILSLPLQVKFYQSECRQHLSWGSQLHFIDYDCNINNMGQVNVERVQYY